MKVRKGDTEVPVLAFVDNSFATERLHGEQIVADLKNEAQQRGEILPAVVWISSYPAPPNIVAAEKLSLNAYDPKEIFDLARSPYKESKYDGSSKGYKELEKSKDQVLVHTLRDAFETIAGRPNQKPWKDWVSQRGDKEPSIG